MSTQTKAQQFEEQLNDTVASFRQFLYDTLAPERLKATPFKTREEQEKELHADVDKALELYREDASKGMKLFLSRASQQDAERLGRIFGKIQTVLNAELGLGNRVDLTADDLNFLEEIAKRRLESSKYSEASCMYRFILQLQLSHSGAWVGWAIAETQMRHYEIVDWIYNMATNLFPENYYICIFAAEYYIIRDEKEKARHLLSEAINRLTHSGQTKSKSYQAIHSLLTGL